MSLCYEMQIEAAPQDGSGAGAITLNATPVKPAGPIVAGQTAELKFAISPDPQAYSGELQAYTFMASRGWRDRQQVKLSTGGIATAKVIPPLPGVYQIMLQSTGNNVKIQQTKNFTFEVKPKK